MEGVRAEINTLSAATIESNKNPSFRENGSPDTHLPILLNQLMQHFDSMEERFKSVIDLQTAHDDLNVHRAVTQRDAEVQTTEPEPGLIISKAAAQQEFLLKSGTLTNTTTFLHHHPPLLEQSCPAPTNARPEGLFPKNASLQHLDQPHDNDPTSIDSPASFQTALPTKPSETSRQEILSILIGYIRTFRVDNDIRDILNFLTRKYIEHPHPKAINRLLLASLLFATFGISVYLSHNSDSVESDHPIWTALQESGGPQNRRVYEILYHA